MLAGLLLNQPVAVHHYPHLIEEVQKLRTNTIPDAVIIQGYDAIRAFIAEHTAKDIQQIIPVSKTARKVAEAKPFATVADVIDLVEAEATEINDEIALLFILAMHE